MYTDYTDYTDFYPTNPFTKEDQDMIKWRKSLSLSPSPGGLLSQTQLVLEMEGPQLQFGEQEYEPHSNSPNYDSHSPCEDFDGIASHSRMMNRRSSLGISMEDILELTGDSTSTSTSTSTSDKIFQPEGTGGSSRTSTKPSTSGSERCSLGHFFSPEELPENSKDLDDCFHFTPTNDDSAGRDITSTIAGDLLAIGQNDADPSAAMRRFSMGLCDLQEILSPPFDLSSPNFSPRFASSYEGYLKSLIECMNQSEQTRARVNKIKTLMKLKENSKFTPFKGISYSTIKGARRKNSKELNRSPRTCSPESDTRRTSTCTAWEREDEPVSWIHPYSPHDGLPPQTMVSQSFSLPRRRSSLALQSFQMDFFPDPIE